MKTKIESAEIYNVYIPIESSPQKTRELKASYAEAFKIFENDNPHVRFNIVPSSKTNKVYAECTHPEKCIIPELFINVIKDHYTVMMMSSKFGKYSDGFYLAENGWNPYLITTGAFTVQLRYKHPVVGSPKHGTAIVPSLYQDSFEKAKIAKTDEFYYEDYLEWKEIIQSIPGIKWEN